MAIDNLNYYSNWLPAWQQTDKYSSQPWCLRSKNLDIFSSSKSVKGTAWSTPSQWAADIIKQEWKLKLKTDGKVYEEIAGVDTLLVDPSINFPVYQVSYTWKNWTYDNAAWGTVQDMSVKYEWNEWRSYTVFTDRASYTYSKVKFSLSPSFDPTWFSMEGTQWLYNWFTRFSKSGTSQTGRVKINIPQAPFAATTLSVRAFQPDNTQTTISLQSVKVVSAHQYYYDAELDGMVALAADDTSISFSWDITADQGIEINNIPINPSKNDTVVQLDFKFTLKPSESSYTWNDGHVNIMLWSRDDDNPESNYAYNYYYSYLPIADRKLVDIWEYYWMKWTSFQPLYTWDWTWTNELWQKKVRYDFVQYMWWVNDVSMDVIGMIVRNEQVYMIWNMNWNWYIIPCDLSWGRWTPYIAYWCTFKWVTNIDYLMYLVGEDRGISQLWVYNSQELVPVLWWNKESNLVDYVNTDEQYKFDWRMVEYRGDLILTTTDNRVFQYWQTYWGKWWTFIHEVPWAITDLKTDWKELNVGYYVPMGIAITSDDGGVVRYRATQWDQAWKSHPYAWSRLDFPTSYWYTNSASPEVWDTLYDEPENASFTAEITAVNPAAQINYSITYQDDIISKNYNTEWEAEYPIVIWNHLLEKEESDLYASYILPNSNCKLEFWGMANHYHFWTFKSSDSYTFSTTASYKMKGCTWNYVLKFIEKNWNYYTFRLEGDLPLQTVSGMKITDTEWTELITYSEYNHFRKIWEITTDGYSEWEFRFHNLNNKLELPKSHSLQIMVRGKGTASYTPELFALDLVANQRDRW